MAKDDEIDEVDPEESELTRIRETLGKSVLDESTIRRLMAENPEGAAEAIIAHVKSRDEATAAMVAREERRTMREYRAKLAEEFPYASPDLISGTTKKELRSSAQRLHKHTEGILTAAGIKPGEKKELSAEERGKEWVQAPAGATEVVREAPVVSDEQLRRMAMDIGGPDAEKKLAAYKEASKNAGIRVITRPSIASALAARAAGPKT